SFWLRVRKPVISTLRLDRPGCSAGKLYTPASLLMAVRVKLVDGLVTVMVAPGTTAPLASRTTPVISPWVCAPRTAGRRKTSDNPATVLHHSVKRVFMGSSP